MFVALPAFQAIATGTTFVEAIYWLQGFGQVSGRALALSYVLAAIVTVLGIALGITDGYSNCTQNLRQLALRNP